MPRIKLTLEYDGTDYVGWQVQKNGVSVQSRVEQALSALLGAPTSVSAAARTDAGVHALGQVACFDTERALPMKAYVAGLAGLLPSDIAVAAAEEVQRDFDPRRWSRGKRYRYLISNRPRRSPLRRRTHWEVFARLDVESMQGGARHLLGRHDFSAFRASDCAAAHAMRELSEVEVAALPEEALLITVRGTAFLKHMVRNLVGSLVEVGKGKHPSEWMGQVLASKDRRQAGPTAPAHGLTLVELFYGAGPRQAGTVPAEEDDE